MAEITNNYEDRGIENFAISSARKSIYKKSNEPLDGYRKVELQSGGVTYHKDVKGVQGYITYLNVSDGEYGTSMTIMLDAKDGSETSALRVRLGGSEFGQIMNKIYNVDFTKQVSIEVYPRKAKSEGSDEAKEYLGVSIRYPNETQMVDGKEMPASPEWLSFDLAPKPEQKRGKWDFSKQEDYFYEKSTEFVDRFIDWKGENVSQGPAESKSEAELPKKAEQPAIEDEEEDDLPF